MDINMTKISINRLIFCIFVLLLGGCAAGMSAYDTSTCVQRGGKVQFKCTFYYSDGTCQTYNNICVGAVTHEQYEKQQQQQQNQVDSLTSIAPAAKKSVEEQARNKLETWKGILRRHGNKRTLMFTAHRFPELTWLSSRWCLKGGNSILLDIFYHVQKIYYHGKKKLGISIRYWDPDVYGKRYTYVHVHGIYYDLWDGSTHITFLRDEAGRRLEKRSNNEIALVYKFKGVAPKNKTDDEAIATYAKLRASEVGPANHIKNPDVYIKCM